MLLRLVPLLLYLLTVYPVPARTAETTGPISVVASFSILADMVRNVGGQHVAVHTIVGPEADAHVYAPSPGDARTLHSANLVIMNGLDFEGWMSRLVESSGYRGKVVIATTGLHPIRAPDAHGSFDPHAWQSLRHARQYVRNIVEGLRSADPAHSSSYLANAKRYLQEFDRLETEIRRSFADIPRHSRRVITTHDAFAYYSADYGIDFIHLLGLSTDSEASASDVAVLIRRIRAERIRALFVENISDPRLLQQVARDAGVRIGGTLYSDALSASDGPAATYLDMVRHNTRQLATALRLP